MKNRPFKNNLIHTQYAVFIGIGADSYYFRHRDKLLGNKYKQSTIEYL